LEEGEVAIVGELPEGWVFENLSEISTKIGSGSTPRGGNESYKSSGIPLIRSMNVHFDGMKYDGLAFIDEIQAEKLKNVEVLHNDVLLNITGASIGRVTIAPKAMSGARVNQHVSIIRLIHYIDPRYVKHFISSPGIQSFIIEAEAGVTRQALTKEKIENLAIPLPPLNEQRQIADRLDYLLTRIDKTKAHLDRIPPLLKRFRQSVLAAATSGKLTEDWREANDIEDFQITQLSEVAAGFSYGSSAKSSSSGLIPVLRMGNIQNGKLDWSDLVFTSDQSEIDKYKLVNGDVLFNRTNSPELVGKTTVYRDEQPAIYAGYLIRVRCGELLLPDYLNYCLNSPAGRDYCWTVKSDGVSQSNINAKKLAEFEFELPQIEEQAEIVRRVETLFAKADRIETQYKKARQNVDRLTPALLAKAFRGELVPQDPKDEPAIVLLERINGEKKGREKREKGRSKKT
jgi:type I restriction enzyme, S subunit